MMKLKFRDYIFIICLSIIPFLSILLSLNFLFADRFTLNKKVLIILGIGLGLIALLSFIMTLFYVLDHILNYPGKKCYRVCHLFWLFLLNIVYVPFYYGYYMVKEKALGIIIGIVFIVSLSCFGYSSMRYIGNYLAIQNDNGIVLKEDFNYLAKNQLFTIDLNKTYVCNKNLGDYVVACDNQMDDSFLGIYSYSLKDHSLGQIDEIYRFHIKQTMDYIKEAGYTYNQVMINDINKITYDNDQMGVLIKKVDYDLDNDQALDYRLIFIKELMINDHMIDDFENVIKTVKFNGSF